VKRSVISAILFSLSFSIAALAQTPSSPPTAGEEIVVTASAIPETVESTPAAVTVVTREEIDRQEARDVADVLREVPGLTVSRTGSSGRATSLFTRGSNSTHTLVLWNGIEIDNPYFAGYDWGRFSTAGVDQVEIVRGPYSALYGSDAVAGVVNILTAPRKSELRGDFETGGNGWRNAQVSGSWVGSSMQFGASYEHRSDDGFNTNDDFSQNTENVFWRWTIAGHFSLGLAGRQTSYDLGIPFNLNGAGTALVPSLKRRGNGKERQLSIPIQQTIGIFSYDATVAESKRNDDFIDPEDPFGQVDSSTSSRTRRARLTTRTVTPIGTIVVGGEYERAVVNDLTNFGPNLTNNRRSERSFFLEDRFSHPVGASSRFELSLGVRRDRYDTFGSQTSPRVAAAVIFGNNKIRAAYGEGFRAPSVGELYYPFAGNLNLRAEHSRSAEVGYDYAMGGAGMFSATLFSGRYRDLIVFDNATFVFGNVGRARTDGLEVSLRNDITSSIYSSISYTYLHTDEDATGKPLPRRPKNSGSIVLGRRASTLDTSIVVLHTGARADVLPVFPFSQVQNSAYTTIDANVQLRMGRFSPYVKMQNLTNKQYDEVLGYRSPGRRAIFGVRVGG
jgi:vitamin B12 transporter